jgi:hypothetical protein
LIMLNESLFAGGVGKRQIRPQRQYVGVPDTNHVIASGAQLGPAPIYNLTPSHHFSTGGLSAGKIAPP